MHRVLMTIVVIGMLNFAAFAVGTFVVHGDALNARSSCPPGDYVSDHGRCHPVSHAVYVYSTVHSYVTITSGLLVMVAAMILNYQKAAKKADPPQWR